MIEPHLLSLATSLLPSLCFGVSVDLNQVIAVGAVDQPGEALLTRNGGVADRPTSSVNDEKEFVSFRDVVRGLASQSEAT
jgi:hypothetical protein